LILEHEVPSGSRVYFGNSAKTKRDIERNIISYLYDNGFEEIVTPNFSYSQHQSLSNKNSVIKINDEDNNSISLRADSTLDVVRIITKRLGRTTSHKKWFYSQPVFLYPSKEFYQIGVELIEYDSLSDTINICGEILNNLELSPIIQLSHSKIPLIISSELDIDLDTIVSGDIAKLLNLDCKWLNDLIRVQTIDDLDSLIKIVPNSLIEPLNSLKDVASSLTYNKVIITPMYVSKLRYYDGVNFRVFNENRVLAKGGSYKSDGVSSLGFAFYIDNLIEEIIKES
jgi:ATP phosphoribosyltransferase regulatory subunit HisZ